jgi:O-antigen ligase
MIRRATMAALTNDIPETPLLAYSRWALAVTVGAMFSYVWRFNIGPLHTTVLEVLILITLALHVAALVQARAWRPRRTGLELPAAALLLAGLIGIAVSPDHTGAVGLYRAYFIEPLALFYVAINVLRTERDFRIVLIGLAAGSTIFAILNLGAWTIALLTHQTIATGNAPEALYSSPNAVAMLLEPPIALATGFALYADSQRDRLVALISLLFLGPAMILTLSRAGLLTMAVLAAVAVVSMPQRRVKLALFAAAVVGGIAISRIPYIAIRLANQLNASNRDNTFEGRLKIWTDTLHMLRDHPIFGAGLRGYARVMVPYVTGGRLPELYPHDVWLAMWAELGLLGLAAFVALVAILLWRGWRGFAAATGFWRPLLWGTAASFAAIAVHGIFDTPYFKNDLAVEFWIVAALEVTALAIINSRADRKTTPPALSVAT